MFIAALIAAPPASAACRSFGTQFECDVGTTRVVIGTQAAEAPSYARSLPIRAFDANGAMLHDRSASRRPFEIGLQDIGADPSLCRKIGNEPYCYQGRIHPTRAHQRRHGGEPGQGSAMGHRVYTRPSALGRLAREGRGLGTVTRVAAPPR